MFLRQILFTYFIILLFKFLLIRICKKPSLRPFFWDRCWPQEPGFLWGPMPSTVRRALLAHLYKSPVKCAQRIWGRGHLTEVKCLRRHSSAKGREVWSQGGGRCWPGMMMTGPQKQPHTAGTGRGCLTLGQGFSTLQDCQSPGEIFPDLYSFSEYNLYTKKTYLCVWFNYF